MTMSDADAKDRNETHARKTACRLRTRKHCLPLRPACCRASKENRYNEVLLGEGADRHHEGKVHSKCSTRYISAVSGVLYCSRRCRDSGKEVGVPAKSEKGWVQQVVEPILDTGTKMLTEAYGK